MNTDTHRLKEKEIRRFITKARNIVHRMIRMEKHEKLFIIKLEDCRFIGSKVQEFKSSRVEELKSLRVEEFRSLRVQMFKGSRLVARGVCPYGS